MTAATHPTVNRTTTTGSGVTPAETTTAKATRYVLAGLRLALGWIFLWAFVDKLFGLGFATKAENAWIDGGSPTQGFLGNAVDRKSTRLNSSHANISYAVFCLKKKKS